MSLSVEHQILSLGRLVLHLPMNSLNLCLEFLGFLLLVLLHEEDFIECASLSPARSQAKVAPRVRVSSCPWP